MRWNPYSKFFHLTPKEIEQAIREYVSRENPAVEIDRIEYSDRYVESRWSGRSAMIYDGYIVRVKNPDEQGLTLSH